MAGLSPTGFERKRLVDIISEVETSLKSAFGENIDVSPQSVFGQIIGIFSEIISDKWESQENVYNSQYPSTAQGVQLSNVVMYNGIERQAASNSTVTATITGLNGTVIPAGSQASVASTGEVFVTDSLVTIPIAGTIDVEMTSQNTGPVSASAGTLTVIDTPIYGWTGITNALDAEEGEDEETDAELRVRRVLSTQALGQNLKESLTGQLLNLTGVDDALVISNGADIAVDGIPAHQFLSVVDGGADASIAQIVWNNTPQGIMSFGSTTVIHTDAQGFPQEVKFSRPTPIDIYFKVDITVDGTFPGTGTDDIKSAIVEYGESNFSISDDVIMSEFYTPINQTTGITSIVLTIGLAPSPAGTTNITISNTEISAFDISQVEVNLV